MTVEGGGMKDLPQSNIQKRNQYHTDSRSSSKTLDTSPSTGSGQRYVDIDAAVPINPQCWKLQLGCDEAGVSGGGETWVEYEDGEVETITHREQVGQ